MYAWGSSAALVLSFAIIAVFAGVPALRRASSAPWASDRMANVVAELPALQFGQLISVALLALCIVTGIFGTQDRYSNFNMTFFWIIFVLAVPYATLLLGDFYRSVNPWKSIATWCDARWRGAFAGVVRYPEWLGYYPALTFYVAFVWVELFAELTPLGLSLALITYSFATIGGAWLFGCRDWFRYGEFFAVFLRLIGYVAPLSSARAGESATTKRRWRMPFAGLLQERTEHVSLLIFILFMLSSTAYDGLHETRQWVQMFWGFVYPHVAPLLSSIPRRGYEQALFLYNLWQWFWLFASPFVYLAVFTVFIAAAKAITRTDRSIRELSLKFALALIPIAVVYHITHYYATLLYQGVQIVRELSDPFGFGWNLFGTSSLAIPPIVIDAGLIWKTQVFLIVAGHIVSSYLAHVEAVRTFPSSRQATVSQIPMLLLMVLFTTVGLKILSMPLGAAQ